MIHYTIQPIYNNYTNEIIELITHIQQKEFNIPITERDQPDLFIIEEFSLSFLL